MADKDFKVKNGFIVSANNSFVVNAASNKVAINAASSNISFYINATDAAGLPSGNTLQRPSSPQAGFTRWNTDLLYLEVYNGSSWGPPGNTASPPTDPTGSNTWIQYNASGSFGANSQFTFNVDTNRLHIGNSTVNTFANSVSLTTGNVFATLFSGANGLFTTTVNVGSNVSLSTSRVFVGNTTVNASLNSTALVLSGNLAINSSMLTIGNTSINVSVNSSMFRIGTANVWTTASLTNTSQLTNDSGFITNVVTALGYTPANKAGDTFTGSILIGANVSLSTSTLTIGNSTVNTTVNSSVIVRGTTVINATGMYSVGSPVWTQTSLTNLSQLANNAGYITNVVTALGYTPANKAGDTFTSTVNVGSNTSLETARLKIGNSTVNAVVNTSGLYINGSTPYTTLGYTPANKAGDTFTGDVYAPIYYDSGDSGYYVDPAGTSRLSNVTFDVAEWNNSGDSRNRFLFNSLGSTIFMGGNSGGTNFEFRPNGGSTLWQMSGSGDFSATGNITAYFSDFRLKTDIIHLSQQDSLEKLKQITPVSFKFNDIGKKLLNRESTDVETGFIAQNIKEVFPEAVAIQPLQFNRTDVIIDKDEPYLTVRPEKLIPLLVNAVKQLSKENDELKDRIRDIEKKFGE